MKHLTEYIVEEKAKYILSEEYKQKAKDALTELVNSLPGIPNMKYSFKRGYYPDGTFWFNPYDILRSPAESAQYIGNANDILLYLNTEKDKDFNVGMMKKAFREVFGANIKESLNEGIFDDNVTKELPEYEWVQNLYKRMSEFFKTKNFSNVKFDYSRSSYNWPAGIYKTLQSCPTVEKDGVIISLYAIDISNFRLNYEFSKIDIIVFVYEKKDPEKVKEIKLFNDSRKAVDCVGRELMVGDTVAYAAIGGFGKYKGLVVGKVTGTTKEMVKVEGNGVAGYRCCLISRKDGKQIE